MYLFIYLEEKKNTFIAQGHIQLIKSDSKTKHLQYYI